MNGEGRGGAERSFRRGGQADGLYSKRADAESDLVALPDWQSPRAIILQEIGLRSRSDGAEEGQRNGSGRGRALRFVEARDQAPTVGLRLLNGAAHDIRFVDAHEA